MNQEATRPLFIFTGRKSALHILDPNYIKGNTVKQIAESMLIIYNELGKRKRIER